MYELIQVSGSSYYVQSPAKIGLVRLNDTDVCLIDSGSDKDAGRKARQILDKNGWRLTAIYNTHSLPTTSAGTGICRARRAAACTRLARSAPSPATRCWSRPCCTAAVRPGNCGTNSSWPRRAMRRT